MRLEGAQHFLKLGLLEGGFAIIIDEKHEE